MRIQDKIRHYPWATAALQQIQSELDMVIREETDIPLEPGGWWHQYVCPEHHTELLFDPLVPNAQQFLCPHGCVLEGEPYRGAWLVFKHQSMARYALQSAVVYAATGETSYAEWSEGVLLRYAAQYPRYPVHPDSQPWMLRGRAFHQALTEALWATTLIRAYLLLRDEGVSFSGGKRELDFFVTMLETSLTEARTILVDVQNKPESNYTAWLNAALASLYALNGDKTKMAALIDGKAGLKHHLTIGVKPDQLEYEGSTYYHVFVLRAYLIAAEMASRLDFSLYSCKGEQGQSFEGMLDLLAALANDRGELPAFHDGPYERLPYSREIAEICEIGISRYQKSEYVPMLMESYRLMYGERTRTGLEALLFGEGDWLTKPETQDRTSSFLEHSGFVVGRLPGSPLSFYADFGGHGGSHGHYDKLHVTLEHHGHWITPELGMVPYGSAMRKQWYASTASHNTVSLNGKSQEPHSGECVSFNRKNDTVYAWLRSRGAYEGCVLNRHLFLTPEWMLDWFEAELSEDSHIDWWMHSPILSPMPDHRQWSKAEGPLGDNQPYSYVHQTYAWRGECGTSSQLTMHGGQGGHVTMSTLAFPSSAIVIARTPGTAQDPVKTMNGLLHRQYGRTGQFVTVYTAGNKQAAELIWLGPDASGNQAVQLSLQSKSWVCSLHLDTGVLVNSC
jgi:hypothetical protein